MIILFSILSTTDDQTSPLLSTVHQDWHKPLCHFHTQELAGISYKALIKTFIKLSARGGLARR